jgi:transcriptional regulator with XRE-family HTH domain
MIKKVQKNKTYEQISERMGLSPQQIHKIEKDAINKMMDNLGDSFTNFDKVIALCSYLGTEPHQIYNKLNKKNRELILEQISKNIG